MMKRSALVTTLIGLMIIVMACNLPGQPTAPPTATAVPETGAVTPSPLPPEAASPTPVPSVTGEGGCTLNSAFVADVTVPDNTPFPPNASFTKTWRLRNTGTCTWQPGTLLVFVSGDAMGGPPSVPVGVVAPGATVDVSVNLTAPASPGTYRGNWQLQAPDGTLFGSVVYVQIVVPQPTGQPTGQPTEQPTGEPTETPTGAPTEESGCVDLDPAMEPVTSWVETYDVEMGCPTAEAFTVYGAFQEFETHPGNPNPDARLRGYMIWRSDVKKIYALGVGSASYLTAHNGRWLALYDDLWDESQPVVHPDCADMDVPEGYQLPVRGFGKVWCENELWEDDRVGWPKNPEWGVTLRIQPAEHGLYVEVTGMPNGYTYVLALNLDAGKWTSMMYKP